MYDKEIVAKLLGAAVRGSSVRLSIVGCCVLLVAVLALVSDRVVTSTGMQELNGTMSFSLAFDRLSYTRSSTVTATLSVADTSTTNSARVMILCDPPDHSIVDSSGLHQNITMHGLGDFGSPTGVTMKPGEHTTISVSGLVSPTAYDAGIIFLGCRLTTIGFDRHQYEALESVQVVGATHTVRGHFATCTGAPLPGVRVNMVRLPPSTTASVRSTVTDAKGALTLRAVPAGLYQVNFMPPPGYTDTLYRELPAGSLPTENMRDTLVTGSGAHPAGAVTMEDPVLLSNDPLVTCP
jgi:hypothetical protein